MVPENLIKSNILAVKARSGAPRIDECVLEGSCKESDVQHRKLGKKSCKEAIRLQLVEGRHRSLPDEAHELEHERDVTTQAIKSAVQEKFSGLNATFTCLLI